MTLPLLPLLPVITDYGLATLQMVSTGDIYVQVYVVELNQIILITSFLDN
jgi:hypothetical protein